MTSPLRFLTANGLYALAIGAYASSFFLPVFGFYAGKREVKFYGYQACKVNLDEGVWSWSFALSLAVWLANPLFWAGAALWLARRRRAAACLAALAAACALIVAGFPFREGYYAWLASFVLLGLAGLSLAGGRREP